MQSEMVGLLIFGLVLFIIGYPVKVLGAFCPEITATRIWFLRNQTGAYP
jgi:hypothetical protein